MNSNKNTYKTRSKTVANIHILNIPEHNRIPTVSETNYEVSLRA